MILKKRVTEEKYFFKNKTLISVQFPIQSQNGSTLDRKKRVVRKVRTRDLTIEVEERQPTTLIISGREVGRQFVETSWFSADQDQKEITKFKPYTGWGEPQPIEANCTRFPLKKRFFVLWSHLWQTQILSKNVWFPHTRQWFFQEIATSCGRLALLVKGRVCIAIEIFVPFYPKGFVFLKFSLERCLSTRFKDCWTELALGAKSIFYWWPPGGQFHIFEQIVLHF